MTQNADSGCVICGKDDILDERTGRCVYCHIRLVDNCTHESASGVDQAPFGPDKVWRCDSCGYLFRTVTDADGISQTVPPNGRSES